MSSGLHFTPEGYRALLGEIRDAGYAFADFETVGESDGVMLLRHDIDKRVDHALAMAEIEADCGVHAHYFFLLHTPLYSVMEPETHDDICRIHALGHTVGLHCDARRVPGPPAGAGIDALVGQDLAWMGAILPFCHPVVSFHNPSPEVLAHRPGGGYLCAYDAPFVMPRTKYVSDSNRRFREPDFPGDLRDRKWKRLQLLVHPVWWMSPQDSPTAILQSVLDRRAAELESYLSYSNDLWREQKGAK